MVLPKGTEIHVRVLVFETNRPRFYPAYDLLFCQLADGDLAVSMNRRCKARTMLVAPVL